MRFLLFQINVCFRRNGFWTWFWLKNRDFVCKKGVRGVHTEYGTNGHDTDRDYYDDREGNVHRFVRLIFPRLVCRLKIRLILRLLRVKLLDKYRFHGIRCHLRNMRILEYLLYPGQIKNRVYFYGWPLEEDWRLAFF